MLVVLPVIVGVGLPDEEPVEGEVTAAPEPAIPVIVTGMNVKSVPEKVSVLEPGKLASAPPKLSAHTAEAVPMREQSMIPVLLCG